MGFEEVFFSNFCVHISSLYISFSDPYFLSTLRQWTRNVFGYFHIITYNSVIARPIRKNGLSETDFKICPFLNIFYYFHTTCL